MSQLSCCHSEFFRSKNAEVMLPLVLPILATYGLDPRSSEANLHWFLSRSATVAGFLTPVESGGSKNTSDTIRMIASMGTRYAGRSTFVWGNEQNIPTMLPIVNANAAALHARSPVTILEGAIFEIVTQVGIEALMVPDYVLKAFGEAPSTRRFNYTAMLFPDGTFVDHWSKGASVPDMTQLETRLWFYYMGTSYIANGCEALHLGQIMLMSKRDWQMRATHDLLTKLRSYAATHARRGFVLSNAHLFSDPWVHVNGTQKLVFDLHAFPSRPQPVIGSPMDCILNGSFTDAIYGHSAGGIAAQGSWTTSSLPYMVELDNYDCTAHPGVQDPADLSHPWGYDEITWFAHTPENEQSRWMRYAAKWIASHDPAGHLEMPAQRCLCNSHFTNRPDINYFSASGSIGQGGFSQETTIKAIWDAQAAY
jgi:hypothetical protein